MNDDLTIEQRINAFAMLGDLLKTDLLLTESNASVETNHFLTDSIVQAHLYNPWFIKESSIFALHTWANLLTYNNLLTWVAQYPKLQQKITPKWIAVIMAGNIPMVGFHDFLSTLICGHNFLGKLSSDDNKLLPAIAEMLCIIEPRFQNKIKFVEQKISDFDAVIATGSNNSARYFDYYFGKYKHIIRKNRNGVAILTGNEDEITMRKLGVDICLYFGLGCRSVSKVFIPEGFDLSYIYNGIEPFAAQMLDHNKYMNNYSYQKSILQMNGAPYFDNNFMLLVSSQSYSSPISMLHYEYYQNFNSKYVQLVQDSDLIQCIVTEKEGTLNTVKPGETQMPGLSNYADGVDTIRFLLEI